MVQLPLLVDVEVFGSFLSKVIDTLPQETWQRWFQIWLSHLAPDLSPIDSYELSLQFTSDTEIADLNGTFRHQNRPTDVLSFAGLDDVPMPPEVLRELPFNLGDIVVSVETAQRQAKDHHHTLQEELAWLTAHGLLHLLGWDHPDEASLQKMWAKQKQLLAQVNLSLSGSAYFSQTPP